MRRQNFSSSSTAVTSSPVATRSRVRLPQPGPNSTTRSGPGRLARLRLWPGPPPRPGIRADGPGPPDRGRPVPTSRSGTGRDARRAAARSKGDASCAGVVGRPTRDGAVELPGPLPVGGGERVVGRRRREGQDDAVEQGPRLVGSGPHERRGVRQHGVELVRARRGGGRAAPARSARSSGAAAGGRRPPAPPRRTTVRLESLMRRSYRSGDVIALSRPRACSGRSATRRRSWRSRR